MQKSNTSQFFYILLMIFFFLITSCSKNFNPTEGVASDESYVSFLLERLASYHNSNDRTSAATLFHASFKHQGSTDIWLIPFMATFGTGINVTLKSFTITVTGDSAMCSFHADWEGPYGSHGGNFPQDNDLGVHILRKDPTDTDHYGGWKIYGDQE